MTATIHALPGVRTYASPEYPPEIRRSLLEWLTVQVTSGPVVIPQEATAVLLGAFADPALAGEALEEAWDSAVNWTGLREDFRDGRGHPDLVGVPGGLGSYEEAHDICTVEARDALDRLAGTTNRNGGLAG